MTNKGGWCNQVIKTNDPYECFAEIDIGIEKSMEKLRNLLKLLNSPVFKWSDYQIKEYIRKGVKALKESCAFCSFSGCECLTSFLMWAHYADSHGGFALEFKFDYFNVDSTMEGLGDSDISQPRKVTYEASKIISNIGPLFQLIADQISFNQPNSLADKLCILGFLSNWLYKQPDWSYEREYRVWMFNKGYWYYQANQLKAVYFGYRMSEDNKN